MDIKLFSDGFDVLINSYSLTTLTGALGPLELNEYEKSVFLTEALNILVKDIYTGRNTMGISFESTEESRRYLARLINEFTKVVDLPQAKVDISPPDNLWFITFEECILLDDLLGCLNNKTVPVVPIRQDDLSRLMNNPFRGPSSNRVFRIDVNNVIRLISKYNIHTYHCYYLHLPTPIILTELGDLNISGYSRPMTCGLNDNLHNTILEMAVKLALVSRTRFITNGDNK